MGNNAVPETLQREKAVLDTIHTVFSKETALFNFQVANQYLNLLSSNVMKIFRSKIRRNAMLWGLGRVG